MGVDRVLPEGGEATEVEVPKLPEGGEAMVVVEATELPVGGEAMETIMGEGESREERRAVTRAGKNGRHRKIPATNSRPQEPKAPIHSRLPEPKATRHRRPPVKSSAMAMTTLQTRKVMVEVSRVTAVGIISRVMGTEEINEAPQIQIRTKPA